MNAKLVHCSRTALKETGIQVSTGSGGQTKYNRIRLGVDKAHWTDATCVGHVESIQLLTNTPLKIKATGHGTRQQCRTDKYGFPARYCDRNKFHFGFQTGDIVRAIVTTGKKIGTYTGRVACRKTGSFNVSTPQGLVQGLSHRFCTSIHQKDGYNYAFGL